MPTPTQILNFLVTKAAACNIVSSLIVLVGGLGLAFRSRKMLEAHRFLLHAFVFWALQWPLYLLMYAFFHFYHIRPEIVIPILVDASSLLVLGFFIAMWYGERFSPGPVWAGVGFFVFMFSVVEFLLGSAAINDPPQSVWRYAWAIPSELLSVGAKVS